MAEDINAQPDAPEDEEEQTPLEQFIFHQRRGLEEFGKAMESLLPPRFKEHTQKAGSEFATGFRVLIDAAIDEIKKASEKDEAEAQQAAQQERTASANLAADSEEAPPSGKIRVELDD